MYDRYPCPEAGAEEGGGGADGGGGGGDVGTVPPGDEKELPKAMLCLGGGCCSESP